MHPGQAPGDRPPVQAADPAQQQRPAGDRADHVRQPVRDGEPGHHLGRGQQGLGGERRGDAEDHGDHANEGGGLAVLERVEDAQLELGEHVRHQAQGEQAEDFAYVPGVRRGGAAVGEQHLGQRAAEYAEVDRGRHHEYRGQPDADREVVPDQRIPARARVLAHPGQQRGDHRDAHDRVRELEQLPGDGIRRVTIHAGRGRVGQDLDDQVAGPLGDHVDRHPAGHPAHLGHLAGPEPERGPPPEPGRPQRRVQRHGLRDHAERGADPEQLDPGRGDGPRFLVRADRDEVERADGDHDQVVDDRRPHRRREPAPGVQDRPDQRAHPVEEDLGDEPVRPHHHQVVLGGEVAARRAVDGARVQVHQRTGQQRGQHGDPQQGQRAQGKDPLRVGLAPVRVAPGRPDQQRYHHAGEDAAEHQVIDGVRQRVGVVVGVTERSDADRVHQDEGAQEAGAP